jgi:hypothetical protein
MLGEGLTGLTTLRQGLMHLIGVNVAALDQLVAKGEKLRCRINARREEEEE